MKETRQPAVLKAQNRLGGCGGLEGQIISEGNVGVQAGDKTEGIGNKKN